MGFKFFMKRTMQEGKYFIISFSRKYLRILSVACTISAILAVLGLNPCFARSQKDAALEKLGETAVNFHEAVPGIYRSGLITEKAVPYLKELGIKTVISFDNNPKRAQKEKRFLEQAGIESILIPWSGWDYPNGDVISKIMRFMEDEARRPVLVHCKHGQERTGVVMACWRITHESWSADQAYQEMKSYGFRPFRYGHLKQYVYDYAKARGRDGMEISGLEQVKTNVLSFFYQLRNWSPFQAKEAATTE